MVRPRATAHAVTGLEHNGVCTTGDEITGRGKPRESRSQDEHVAQRPASSSPVSTRSASGGR